MSVVHIVGARPQFVKAAAVLGVTPKEVDTVLVHTGQHYDPSLSKVFFDELALPEPDHYLGIGSGTHGAQTGAMLAAIETVLLQSKPGVVVVYGDTNSTLAGALAAAKLGWKLVHIESGLRSFDRSMPEELNRIATDHISDLLLCPTRKAMEQLAREGLENRALFTGDVMLDIALDMADRARTQSKVGRFLHGLEEQVPESLATLPKAAACLEGYALATVHRASNTDDPVRLGQILEALGDLPVPVVLPLHPRTRAVLDRSGIEASGGLHLVEPAGYLDFMALINGCSHVFTDSGGVQKEALFAGRLCTTLRNETEWLETLVGDWNVLVGADPDQIKRAATRDRPITPPPTDAFGNGQAGRKVVRAIESFL